MNQNANSMNGSPNSTTLERNRKDTIVKELADDAGRVMFLLETYIKLYQTQDHQKLQFEILKEIRADVVCLSHSVEELFMEGGPNE